jgi:hypothetical protein
MFWRRFGDGGLAIVGGKNRAGPRADRKTCDCSRTQRGLPARTAFSILRVAAPSMEQRSGIIRGSFLAINLFYDPARNEQSVGSGQSLPATHERDWTAANVPCTGAVPTKLLDKYGR